MIQKQEELKTGGYYMVVDPDSRLQGIYRCGGKLLQQDNFILAQYPKDFEGGLWKFEKPDSMDEYYISVQWCNNHMVLCE